MCSGSFVGGETQFLLARFLLFLLLRVRSFASPQFVMLICPYFTLINYVISSHFAVINYALCRHFVFINYGNLN